MRETSGPCTLSLIRWDNHRLMNLLRSILFLSCLMLTMAGCDPAYRYLFFPPERMEYTLEPDPDLLHLANDTSYSISRDSLSVVYDRKSFKVEVKYLPDFQLNNYEFPDDSRDGEFSANPFTYANWIEPQLGFTPNRFSVFKVSIYNYASAKLNYDPELSFLVSDRGDILAGYGREEKSSRNQSIEGYFRKRKGSSGVEDEIFERRMGIVRQTVLYLGRPIFQGDSREGIVVYDPLHESVERVKLVMNNFMTGYDENNEPSEFANLQFFFRRVPLNKEDFIPPSQVQDTLLAEQSAAAGATVAGSIQGRTFEMHQIRYRVEEEEGASVQQDWNAKPNALNSLATFLRDSLKVRPTNRITPIESPDLLNAKVAFFFCGPSKPLMADIEIQSLANLIRRGGFLFIDNSAFSSNYLYFDQMVAMLQAIGAKVDRTVRVMPVPNDHQIYKVWKRTDTPPRGMDDIENMPEKRNYLQGLFWRDQLVAVVSSKGYSMMWNEQDPENQDQYALGANVVAYALSTLKAQQ